MIGSKGIVLIGQNRAALVVGSYWVGRASLLLVETGSQDSTVRAGPDGRDTVRAGRSVQASPAAQFA